MAKLEQVGSLIDGFVHQSIGVTINLTKFFVAETVPSSTGFSVLGLAINFQMISRFMAVVRRGFAAVHVSWLQ